MDSAPSQKSDRVKAALVQVGEIGGAGTLAGLLSQALGASSPSVAGTTLLTMLVAAVLVHRAWLDAHLPASAIALAGLVLLAAGWRYAKTRPGPDTGAGLVRYVPSANHFLGSEVEARLRSAEEEVLFFGTTFHITAGDARDAMLAALENGVRIRILALDPFGTSAEGLAFDFDVEESEFWSMTKSSTSSLHSIGEAWAQRFPAALNPGEFEVRFYDAVPRMRLYSFDPSRKDGETYVVPYINRMDSADTPGLLCTNDPSGIAGDYLRAVNKVWGESLPLADLIAQHPDYLK